jgi:thioesterase-3
LAPVYLLALKKVNRFYQNIFLLYVSAFYGKETEMQKTTSKVYGFHLDMYGHVNNARYLEFLEAARWEFIAQKMDINDLETRGIAFLVVNINISYRQPATLNQTLEIETQMAHISGKSAKVHQEIYIKGQDLLVAEADITFVIIDVKKNKVLPIKGEVKDILENFKS